MRCCLTSCLASGLLSWSLAAHADVLSVGPAGSYTAPCAAFAAASDGDSIEISADGSYDGDVCAITKNRLTIRGVGGLAKVDADGMNAQGKGTWVVQGDDTVIENVEFSGASVPDMNGAGIRQEGKNLTVRGCVFHDNENGILAGDVAGSVITIEHSEFDHNGAGDGQSHNLYINHVEKLVFRYNWSHRAVIGHLLKSRAAENHVLYNRISGEDGTPSYELNFPNGGKTYVIGNLIQQGEDTDNPSLLAYLEEGESATNPSHQLYVVSNTFVNARSSGTFLNLAVGAAPAVIVNNAFVGAGTVTNQAGAMLSHNLEDAAACLTDVAAFDYRLAIGSPCVDAGVDPGEGESVSLLPTEHYVHPLSHVGRNRVGVIDIGAYELGGDGMAPGGSSNGGSSSDAGRPATAASGSAGKPSGGANAAGQASAGGASGSESDVTADDDGCSCRAASGRPSAALSYGLLLFVGGWLRRRRRHLQ